MEVYTIDEDTLTQVPDSAVEYEQDLQSHLLKAQGAKIGDLKLMYVSQEGTPDREGGYFDILGVTENGDAVIVELKRGKAPRVVVSQALEYASGIRKEGYDRFNDRFQAFRRERGEDAEEDIREAHADFFKIADDPLAEREFNNDIHLVVLAAEFDDLTLNMADLLREHELDVVCVRYQTFVDPDEELRLLTTESVRRPLALEPGDRGEQELTATEEIQVEFWEQLVDKIDESLSSDFYTDSTKPRNWLPVRGTLPTDADIALVTDTRRGQIQVKLHLRDDDSAMFQQLYDNKSEIESEIGEELIWDDESARGYDQIRLVRDADIRDNRSEWGEYHDWLLEYWQEFDSVFGSYLRR